MPKKTIDTGSNVSIPSREDLMKITRSGVSIRLLFSYLTMPKEERKELRSSWTSRRQWKRTKKCKRCGNKKTFRFREMTTCIVCGEEL